MYFKVFLFLFDTSKTFFAVSPTIKKIRKFIQKQASG